MGQETPSLTRQVTRGTALSLAGALGATVLTGIAFAQAEVDPAASPDGAAADPRGVAGQGMGIPGDGPLLHGQQVVRTAEGGYAEILVQNGTITAVSADSITVRSEDGFEQPYSIDAETKIRIDREQAPASALHVDRPARIVADTEKSAQRAASTTAAGQAAFEGHTADRQEFRNLMRDRLGGSVRS